MHIKFQKDRGMGTLSKIGGTERLEKRRSFPQPNLVKVQRPIKTVPSTIFAFRKRRYCKSEIIMLELLEGPRNRLCKSTKLRTYGRGIYDIPYKKPSAEKATPLSAL